MSSAWVDFASAKKQPSSTSPGTFLAPMARNFVAAAPPCWASIMAIPANVPPSCALGLTFFPLWQRASTFAFKVSSDWVSLKRPRTHEASPRASEMIVRPPPISARARSTAPFMLNLSCARRTKARKRGWSATTA